VDDPELIGERTGICHGLPLFFRDLLTIIGVDGGQKPGHRGLDGLTGANLQAQDGSAVRQAGDDAVLQIHIDDGHSRNPEGKRQTFLVIGDDLVD
jgi:hypothetical protein